MSSSSMEPTTSDSGVSILELVHLLSIVSDDAVRLCDQESQYGRTPSRNPQSIDMPDILDELASILSAFLGKPVGVTMAISPNEIVLTLASSSDLVSTTSKTILEKLWSFMKSSASRDIAPSLELVGFLVGVQANDISRRFLRHASSYQRFWQAMSEDDVSVQKPPLTWKKNSESSSASSKRKQCSRPPLGVSEYINDANKVYTATQTFCSSSETQDKHRLNFYWQMNPLVSHLREFGAHIRSLYERRFEEIFEMADDAAKDDLTPFDVVGYVDQLCAPIHHVNTIMEACWSRVFKDVCGMSLRVDAIYSNSASARQPTLAVSKMDPLDLTEARIHLLLRDIYSQISTGSDLCTGEQDKAIDAVVNSIAISNSKSHSPCTGDNTSLKNSLALNKHLEPQATCAEYEFHPECLLIQYHLLSISRNPSTAPYSHIGTSIPSCLYCRLFLDACNAFSMLKRWWVEFVVRPSAPAQTIASSHYDLHKFFPEQADPPPLPKISNEADAFVASHMRRTVYQIIGKIIKRKIEELRPVVADE